MATSSGPTIHGSAVLVGDRAVLIRGPSGADDVTKQRYHDVIDTFCDSVVDLLKMIELAAEFERFWLVSVYTPNSKGDLSRLELRYRHWDPAFLAFVTGGSSIISGWDDAAIQLLSLPILAYALWVIAGMPKSTSIFTPFAS